MRHVKIDTQKPSNNWYLQFCEVHLPTTIHIINERNCKRLQLFETVNGTESFKFFKSCYYDEIELRKNSLRFWVYSCQVRLKVRMYRPKTLWSVVPWEYCFAFLMSGFGLLVRNTFWTHLFRLFISKTICNVKDRVETFVQW